MSNTVKTVLGLVLGLVVVSFIWSGLKNIFFIVLFLGVGYFVVKSIVPNLLGKGKKKS